MLPVWVNDPGINPGPATESVKYGSYLDTGVGWITTGAGLAIIFTGLGTNFLQEQV